MYLKALEMQGFKSFPDKTRLTFDQDITAIVGPNGSGKSNLSDAILWVMGEQRTRTLRGGKMEDVIFGGTEKRGKLGFAQVSLVLDNSAGLLPVDHEEVTITRRYYRGGESEYYINREACRLKDIHELLMDTGLGRDGYSIIGQGRIAEIVSGKSGERREIFEEAAGISRFRYRKEESERKLQRTEENLLRINDKVDELELQIEPLRRQSEAARKYLDLRAELKDLEVSVWMETLDRLKEQNETVQRDYAAAQENLSGAQAELDRLYAASETCAEQMRAQDVKAEELRAQIAQSEQDAAALDADAAVLRANMQSNAESIARMRIEAAEQADRVTALDQQIKESRERQAKITEEKRSLAEKIAAVDQQLAANTADAGEADRAFAAILQRENEASAALAEFRTGLTMLADQSQTLIDRENAVESESSETSRNLLELEQQLKDYTAAREKAEQRLNDRRAEMKRRGDAFQSADQALRAAQSRLSTLTVDLRSAESRLNMLEDLERGYEGYSKAVKTVMREQERGVIRGIHGPVANLLRADDRYALAVETALGASAQHIVVDTQRAGADAIRLLKQKDGGRATFLPLDTIRPSHLNEQPKPQPGYIGVASDLVKSDARYADIVSNLLGRTLVAENLDRAMAIAKSMGNRVRVVTLDGQVVNAGGSLTGGSAARGSGILSRANELSRLRWQREKLTAEKTAQQTAVQEAETAFETAQTLLDTAREQTEQAQESLHLSQREEAQAELLLQTAQSAMADQQKSLDAIRAEQREHQHRIDDHRAALKKAEAALEQVRAEKQAQAEGRERFDSERAALAESLAALRAEDASLDAERDTIDRTLEQISGLFRELTEDRAARLEQITQAESGETTLRAQLKETEGRLTAVRMRIDGQKETLTAALNRRMELEGERTRTDKQAQEQNRALLDMQGLVAKFEQKKLAADMEEKQILDKLWDNYELSHTAAQKLRQPIESMHKANRRMSELRRGIGALGTPNLGAIEEFERVNTRYTFLTGQRDDVLKAKRELMGIISDITAEMEMIFRREFAAIDAEFRKTFLELFGGGKAALVLEDEENVLDCGIEIRVQPPGKAVSAITLLSGGEKSFVAIALYFAILKVRPTPFCVMDEIEAALDEANVSRFAGYMRNLSKNTQFLVITHRRGTMEEADHLFGVTMQEKGVSRVIGLSLDEAAKAVR